MASSTELVKNLWLSEEVIIPVGESTFDALPNDNAVNCLRKMYVSICQLQQLSAKSEKPLSTVGDSQSA